MEQGHHTRIILILLMNKSKSPYLPYELKIFNECNSGQWTPHLRGDLVSVNSPNLSVIWPKKHVKLTATNPRGSSRAFVTVFTAERNREINGAEARDLALLLSKSLQVSPAAAPPVKALRSSVGKPNATGGTGIEWEPWKFPPFSPPFSSFFIHEFHGPRGVAEGAGRSPPVKLGVDVWRS